ncbi:hypothetical protein ABK040_011156 [Willaertia magna]
MSVQCLIQDTCSFFNDNNSDSINSTNAYYIPIRYKNQIKFFNINQTVQSVLSSFRVCESYCTFEHLNNKPLRLNIEIYHYITNNNSIFNCVSCKSQQDNILQNVFILKSIQSDKLLGGKGGFGSLLRHSKAKKKTTNFSAMRDLNGRRFRQLLDENALRAWRERQDRLRREEEERRREIAERKQNEKKILMEKEVKNCKEKEELVKKGVLLGLNRSKEEEEENNNSSSSMASSSNSDSNNKSLKEKEKKIKVDKKRKRTSKFDIELSDEDETSNDEGEQ